ncbi:MAG: hypothetical protein Kow0068_04940 [Marinilabiliales bacterium]
MIKYIFWGVIFLFTVNILLGQEKSKSSVNIYDPNSDAMKDIKKAIKKADLENKHVMIQVGGNWCPWCIKFHNYIKENRELDSLIQANYIFVLVNYSREQKNPEAMKFLEYPQRFGFPVLVILDNKGKRIHTQDSGYLEQDKSYNYDRVKRFIMNWTKSAISPENYEKD